MKAFYRQNKQQLCQLVKKYSCSMSFTFDRQGITPRVKSNISTTNLLLTKIVILTSLLGSSLDLSKTDVSRLVNTVFAGELIFQRANDFFEENDKKIEIKKINIFWNMSFYIIHAKSYRGIFFYYIYCQTSNRKTILSFGNKTYLIQRIKTQTFYT